MASLSRNLIEITDARFRWPRAKQLTLDIAHFSLQANEKVFLHGPSGCGKSTLLGLVGGVLLPDSGNISIMGTNVPDIPSKVRDRFRVDHIGFIFQQFNLLPHLSVVENVLLPCHFSGKRRERACEKTDDLAQEALRLLAELDLSKELCHKPVNALSIGQQQRVAAARALIGRPEIIIADEPTSSLDAARQNDFLQLLLNECSASGAAVLFVSHDSRLAHHFDRAVALPEINQVVLEEAGI